MISCASADYMVCNSSVGFGNIKYLQNRPFCSVDLNKETLGDSRNASLCWGNKIDVKYLAPATAGMKAALQ